MPLAYRNRRFRTACTGTFLRYDPQDLHVLSSQVQSIVCTLVCQNLSARSVVRDRGFAGLHMFPKLREPWLHCQCGSPPCVRLIMFSCSSAFQFGQTIMNVLHFRDST